jgi:hypothetical protein
MACNPDGVDLYILQTFSCECKEMNRLQSVKGYPNEVWSGAKDSGLQVGEEVTICPVTDTEKAISFFDYFLTPFGSLIYGPNNMNRCYIDICIPEVKAAQCQR